MMRRLGSRGHPQFEHIKLGSGSSCHPRCNAVVHRGLYSSGSEVPPPPQCTTSPPNCRVKYSLRHRHASSATNRSFAKDFKSGTFGSLTGRKCNWATKKYEEVPPAVIKCQLRKKSCYQQCYENFVLRFQNIGWRAYHRSCKTLYDDVNNNKLQHFIPINSQRTTYFMLFARSYRV